MPILSFLMKIFIYADIDFFLACRIGPVTGLLFRVVGCISLRLYDAKL